MKKSLALCAVLMGVAVVVSGAQDTSLRTNLSSTTTASTSDSEQAQAQVSTSAAPTPETGTMCEIKHPAHNHGQSQFATYSEYLSSTSLLPSHVKSYNPAACLRENSAEVPPDEASQSGTRMRGFQWSPAIKESVLFLGVQQGYAITQPKTRRDLQGPFFGDYVRSVRSLHGWEDGGRFFTNYVAHPLQGSLLGFIQIQNDPKGITQRVGKSQAYWRSRLKALAWSAAWSTQFEIGPISQASIGNVGLHGKQTYIDLVITPIAGLGLLVVEDALDKYLVQRIERSSGSFYLKIASRVLLNPTRSVANLIRFKKPWHRDGGLR